MSEIIDINVSAIENNEEFFGPLWVYIQNKDVTDINWNGRQLWIDDLRLGRYMSLERLDPAFVDAFSVRVSNLVNRQLNRFNKVLEAETETLRISILHESATNTGRSISIRATLPERRIDKDAMLNNNYCTKEWDDFIRAAIEAHMNISIAGLPGVGKTEYLKTLTEYIPADERVITIEDNLEIRYSTINPGKDCVEIKVDEHMPYSEAIKAALRQFPKWLMLSEARGTEVVELVKAWSTGVNGITTIHTDSVLKIPDRMENMSGEYSEPMRNNIYSFLDIGILVASIKDRGTGLYRRRIAEAAFFSRINGTNSATMFYRNGKFLTNKLPEDIKHKFDLYEVPNPLAGVQVYEEQKEA